MTDPFTGPEWAEYERRAREELWPMMSNSAVHLSLIPNGVPDVKFALELGFMVMLGKPVIALVQPGTQVPEKLVRIADHIIEFDPADIAGTQSRVAAAIASVTERD